MPHLASRAFRELLSFCRDNSCAAAIFGKPIWQSSRPRMCVRRVRSYKKCNQRNRSLSHNPGPVFRPSCRNSFISIFVTTSVTTKARSKSPPITPAVLPSRTARTSAAPSPLADRSIPTCVSSSVRVESHLSVRLSRPKAGPREADLSRNLTRSGGLSDTLSDIWGLPNPFADKAFGVTQRKSPTYESRKSGFNGGGGN